MEVPAPETLRTLRVAFERWGLPERIRVDNGYPWISTGDLPTELGLWLLGLDVELTANPPRRPQDNAVVEGAQGTGQRWAEPPRCATAAELQRRLDEMDEHQRDWFPDERRSRTRLFPALAHSGRRYHRRREAASWEIDRLRAKLSRYVVARRINARGLVSIYGRNYYVGRRHAEATAFVHLDAESGDWLFELVDGPVLARHPAGLTRRAILTGRVSVTHRG
jgi:hypothetical protein